MAKSLVIQIMGSSALVLDENMRITRINKKALVEAQEGQIVTIVPLDLPEEKRVGKKEPHP